MKKVLSFVLSVAMVICLMPVMAFADGEDAAPTTTATATGLSQFSDADSINNKEAVTVLVGLGIVDGMGDGTFQPAGNLTRAQASKLVATLVKSGDKSEIPAPAADPFTDVAKTYWGAGAIQFGVDNGYINGMGDGTFHPEDQVTTAQLATMLDKLLGYSVADINYQWPENAMAKAVENNLLKKVSKGSNDSLNREEAAQMIFNALKASTWVKNTTTGSGDQDVKGDSYYDEVLNTVFDYGSGNPTVQELIEKYFPKVTRASNSISDDPFKRPVTVWKNGRTKITDEVIDAPVLTYTDQQVSSDKPTEKASDQLKDDLDGYTLASNCQVFRNGNSYVIPGLAAAQNSDEIADAVSKVTGNGILVEVYSDDRDIQIKEIVIADYHMVRVTKVNSKDNTIELSGCDKVKEKDNFYSNISTVSKGEYVLAAIKGTEVIDAYIPTADTTNASVTKITSRTKTGLQNEKGTIGDKEYTVNHMPVVAFKVDVDNTLPYKVDVSVTGSALTDKYGYLVGYKQDNESAKDWALLTSIFTQSPTNDFGESSTDFYAQIVKEDGTIDTISILYDNDTNSSKYDSNTVRIVDGFTGPRNDSNKGPWFRLAGKLVTFDETADGFKLNDSDGQNSTPHEVATEELTSKSTKIGSEYIANPVSVITVSGSKASKLEAKTASKPKEVKADPTTGNIPYKYVTKKSGNNTLVTTIFVVGAGEDPTLIKVTADTGSETYGSAQKAGRSIEYYTDDSTEAQTLVVASNTTVAKGWYAIDEIKEGMNLTDAQKAGPGAKVVEDHIVGSMDSGYGNSITFGTTEYKLDENLTIVDLDERGGITDAESLIAEINAVAANPSDNDTLKLSFAYTIDDGKKIVKQVYIEKNPDPAPTNNTQQGNENQQPGDNTQQGEQAQQGDDTQQGEQAQQGDDTQQGEQAQQGDDTQQGGGDEVAG